MFSVKIVVSLTLITLTVYACGGGTGSKEVGPAAEASVTSATDLGVLENNSVIGSRFGGYSADFGGYSVWLYGDSYLTKINEDNYGLISNSWSYTTDLDASNGITGFQEPMDNVGVPKQFIPLTYEEKTFNDLHNGENCTEAPCNTRWAIWPGAIVIDSEKNWAYIFYGKTYIEPGDFNLKNVGQSIAVWKDFNDPPERPVFNRVNEHPTLIFEEADPAFGSAALVDDTDLYVYGCDTKESIKPCHLARVPIADVLNPDAWRYYASNDSWSSSLDDAQTVFDGNDVMSVFYSPYVNRYLAVYILPLINQTMLRTAPRPEGPWSKPVKVFKAMASISTTGWVNDVLVHPKYTANDGQTIYITYSRQIATFQSVVRLVAVEIEKTSNN